MLLKSTSSSKESMVKSLLEKLIEDTVADIENNEIFWKLVEKVLQHVPRLDIDKNNGIETLRDLAFKFWDDFDIYDDDACLNCLFENMPVTDHPKIFVDGKEIHLLPLLDVTDNLALGSGGEGVAPLGELTNYLMKIL